MSSCIEGTKLKYKSDTTDSLPRLVDPDLGSRLWIVVGLLLLSTVAFRGSQFDLLQLFEPHSWRTTAEFFTTFWPPRTDIEFLQRLLDATIATVSIATVATVLAMLVATPFAVMITSRLSLSARGRPMKRHARLLRAALRGIAIFLRSVPELIWALLFIGVTGLGATAGIIGLLFTNIGIFAKNYAEIIESGETTVTGNLLDNGNGRVKTLLHGTLGQGLPELLSYSVYRWECTLRTSVVLGFVGAGGLGQELLISVRQLASPEVFSIVLVFVLLVFAADSLSASLRYQLSDVTKRVLHTPVDVQHHKGRSESIYGSTFRRYGSALFVTVMVFACFANVDWQLHQWLRADSLGRSVEFVQGFLTPDLTARMLSKLTEQAIETLSMAFTGTVLAGSVAIILSYTLFVLHLRDAHSIGSSVLIGLIQLIQIVLRSIPELVWAMLLIVAVGIGPFTGTLALCAASVGVLSRLYTECLHNQEKRVLENLLSNGGSVNLAPLWSTFVQARSQLISYSLYRWEHNLRAATLMGIVGAGGVGQELYLRLSLFQFDKVATCVMVIVAMVVLADAVSYKLRHRFASSV